MNKYLLIILLWGIALTSCQHGTAYKEYKKFDTLTWERFDYLKFETEIEDVNSYYDIYLNIRHLPEYPYKKLDINLTIFPPSGGYRSSEHRIWLKKTDQWESDCLGDYCDYEALLKESYKFSKTGKIQFEIENKMTKFETPGIMEIGLIIKKKNKK